MSQSSQEPLLGGLRASQHAAIYIQRQPLINSRVGMLRGGG